MRSEKRSKRLKQDQWHDVYVILPTLNEREGLELVLRDLKSMKFPMKNVIVLDGYSIDGTQDVAKKYGVRIILQKGEGKGMAFQTFLEEFPIKENAIYIMLDADYSYDPFEMPVFIKILRSGREVVLGRRKILIHNFKSLVHTVAGFVLSLIASLLYFRLVLDLCTGYWGFKGVALKRIKINAAGFDLEANLWSEISKKNLKFSSVSIDYRKRMGYEKIKPVDGLKIIFRLLKERAA